MAEGQDFTFMFDTEQFKNAVKDVTSGLNRVNATAERTFSKGNVNKMGARFGAFAAVAGGAVKGIGRAIGGVFSKISNAVPEIGQTFNIVSDIFLRNLLFPLRKFLIPMLQKILDWTRKHRAMFLRWGQFVVNIFKTIITTVKGVINLFKTLFDSFREGIAGVFGEAPKNIEKTLNVFMFKMTVVVQYIIELLKPLMKVLGTVWAKIVEIGKEFSVGWMEGLQSVFKFSDAVEKLKTSFAGLSEAFEKLGLSAPKAKGVFAEIGKFLGKITGAFWNEIVNGINNVVLGLTNIIDLIAKIKENDFSFKDLNLFKGMELPGKELINVGLGYGERVGERLFGGGEEQVDDAIIKGDRIIRTDPADTIVATKNDIRRMTPGGEQRKTMTVNLNTGGTLNVTEGNAEQAGRNFVQGVGQRLYTELLDLMTAEGSF